ncbi:uncharacterized protein LOC116012627 [Ipomoea triloba]|uniref:uncharacterized protein LOC116012627 n=1 Tax=Ipomoea triloba TaxID=35885 RepID=UPI00125E80E3|nr:uncharacterized protein LOC116012627 [Ipomoea triloba]
MSSIAKREFTELAIDGSNYLTWALDVEMHLTSKDLKQTIADESQSTDAQKAQALIFLRHHLNNDLKNEYLTEKDPHALWKSLKDRFDQQLSIVLPQAQFDWPNLRFQDYKSVIEYNSALHKIVSQLKLCKYEVSESDLIEKTLSTFHASNLVLQQQYRAKNYDKHSELISALLVAEKHNQLLMKNHNARPVGSAPVPEAHNIAKGWKNRRGRGKGRGGRHGRGNRRGMERIGFVPEGQSSYNRGNRRGTDRIVLTQGNQNSSKENSDHKQVCYRCGCSGHWSRTCRIPRHLVDAYQMMMKKDDKQPTKNESHHASTSLPAANAVINDDDDDLLMNYEIGDIELEE